MKTNTAVQLQLCSLTLTPVRAISFTPGQRVPIPTEWASETVWTYFEVDTNLCSLPKIEPRSFRDHYRLPVALFLPPIHARVTTKAVVGINSDSSCAPFTCRYGIFNTPSGGQSAGRLLLTSIVTNYHACSPCPQLWACHRFRVPGLEIDALGVSVHTGPSAAQV